jgi:hypothetical protein
MEFILLAEEQVVALVHLVAQAALVELVALEILVLVQVLAEMVVMVVPHQVVIRLLEMLAMLPQDTAVAVVAVVVTV